VPPLMMMLSPGSMSSAAARAMAGFLRKRDVPGSLGGMACPPGGADARATGFGAAANALHFARPRGALMSRSMVASECAEQIRGGIPHATMERSSTSFKIRLWRSFSNTWITLSPVPVIDSERD